MSTRDDRWAGMRGFGHLREGSEPLVHSQPVCVSWIAQIGDHPVSFLFFHVRDLCSGRVTTSENPAREHDI